MKQALQTDETFSKFLTKESWRIILPLLYREDIGRLRRVCRTWLNYITKLNLENGNLLPLNDKNNPNFLQQFSPSHPNHLPSDARIYKPYYYFSPFDKLFTLARTERYDGLVGCPASLHLRELGEMVNDKKFQGALMDALSAIAYENTESPKNKMVSIDRLVSLICKDRKKIELSILEKTAHNIKYRKFDLIDLVALSMIEPKSIAVIIALACIWCFIYAPNEFQQFTFYALAGSLPYYWIIKASDIGRFYKTQDMTSLDSIEDQRCKKMPALLKKGIPIALLMHFHEQTFSSLVSILTDQNKSTDMRCLAAYSLAIRYQNENDEASKNKLDRWMTNNYFATDPVKALFKISSSLDSLFYKTIEEYGRNKVIPAAPSRIGKASFFADEPYYSMQDTACSCCDDRVRTSRYY